MKKSIIALVVVVLIGGTAALVVMGQRASNAASTGNEPTTDIPPVKAANEVVADATVVPVRSADLSLSVGGIVEEVLVKEGDSVQEGDVLLRLGAATQKAAVAQAEAEVMRAQAQLDELAAEPRPEEIEVARAALAAARAQLQKAYNGGRGIGVADVDAAKAEVRRAEAQLALAKAGTVPESIASARAQVAVARAALQSAQVALEQTVLRAPFAGTVVSVSVAPGEYLGAGSGSIRFADLSSWQIETEDLTELSIVHVREGATATVTIDALPDVQFGATVSNIESFGRNSRGDITYRVTLVPNQDDASLRWNMTAAVTIPIQ